MKVSVWFCALLVLAASFGVRAESFVVEGIEVVGIKKISTGTVLSYLPVNVGEPLELERTPDIIRELYSTGFFDDIKLQRRDNTLVIEVKERPSIAEINFEGNKDIEDEAFVEALDSVGISKGRIFDQHKLDRMELELQEVYYSLGKYAARIETSWRELDEDRVAIDINISEGISAKIKSINISGNRVFDEDELRDVFQLETSDDGWFVDDEYSSSKLSADTEALRSFYEDRGFILYELNSQQVTISPDRKDITISLGIREGEQFRISAIDISGELVVTENELRALVTFREGDVFSGKEIGRVIQAMQKRLAEDGYAYAEVRTLRDIDEEQNTVGLRFLVVPGNKMRVRYINFVGNYGTKDEVLRREMRQFEGEMYRQSKVDRSRVRLQRLNFVGTVNIARKRVENSEDLVDLEITVTERFSGNLSVGLGFSQTQGAILNLGFTHENILGTGNTMSLTFDNSEAFQRYRFRYLNPYYTTEGVSRGFNFVLTETDASENNTSNYLLDEIELSIDYGIPLTEFNTLRLELGVVRDDFQTTSGSSREVFDFVRENNDDKADLRNSEIDGDEYDTVFATVSLAKDTRNRRIFADSGHLNSVALNLHTGDLDYYETGYRHQTAFALSELFTFNFLTRVSYGDGYGDTDDLPIFEKYATGGVRSVRGYEFNSLGPQDSNNDTFGGNFRVLTTTEILFPVEYVASAETFRVGLYFDAGNAFAEFDDYETSELRQSVGISAKWFSVIGPVEFSYAFPLNDKSGDDTQEFQFALGAQF